MFIIKQPGHLCTRPGGFRRAICGTLAALEGLGKSLEVPNIFAGVCNERQLVTGTVHLILTYK
jgi:hypothetical protein